VNTRKPGVNRKCPAVERAKPPENRTPSYSREECRKKKEAACPILLGTDADTGKKGNGEFRSWRRVRKEPVISPWRAEGGQQKRKKNRTLNHEGSISDQRFLRSQQKKVGTG